MDTMGMPTPEEAWHTVEEAIEKLHEIDLALGGMGLLEAAKHLQHMGVAIKVVPQAAALTVSWWVGNAVGCVVTAAVGEQLREAIEFLARPVTWTWVEAKMNEVNYPMIELPTVEETTTRSSSTTQDDPPPNPVIDRGSDEADWVRYLQRLLVEQHGYQLDIDGDFGPKTAAAVRDFKQRHNLGNGTEVDRHTWRALEAATSPVAADNPPST